MDTYQVPAPPPLPSGKGGGGKPSVFTERYASPGDVFECGCGRAWVARVEAVATGFPLEHEWRREHWWERRRRLNRHGG